MKYTRRAFLNSAGIAGMFGLSNMINGCGEAHGLEGILIDEEDGEVVYIGNQRKAKITFKISARSNKAAPFSLLAEIIPPGDFIPEHKHLKEDEFIFIYKGKAEIKIEEDRRELINGGMAFIPKGKWHGLKNTGNDYMHMFFGYSPAGFEDYFRQIGVKSLKENLKFAKEDWERTSKKYGVIYR